jgi:hypothetical protein
MSSNSSSSDEGSSTSVTSSSTVDFPTRRKDYLKAFQKEIIDHEFTKKKLKDSKIKCKKLEIKTMDTLSRLSREHQDRKRKLDEREAKLDNYSKHLEHLNKEVKRQGDLLDGQIKALNGGRRRTRWSQ